MTRLLRLWRYLWVAPISCVGLLWLAVALASGGSARLVDGVGEVAGGLPARVLGRLPFAGAVAAMTLGHVVVGVSMAHLDATRAHERVHVRQMERWGLLFALAYPLAGLWAGLRGGDLYRDNRFEREARAVAGY